MPFTYTLTSSISYWATLEELQKSAKDILLIRFKMYIYNCRTSSNTSTLTDARNFASYKYKVRRKVAIETRKIIAITTIYSII